MASNAVSTEESGHVTPDEFDRVARLHCRRWTDRSLNVVRAILVDEKRLSDAAQQFGMTPQQANVLRTRFIARMRDGAAVKLPAEEFMQAVTPANASLLTPFKNDIRQLVKRGYSQSQIMEFLQANDVKVATGELSTFLGAMNENAGASESKGRRR